MFYFFRTLQVLAISGAVITFVVSLHTGLVEAFSPTSPYLVDPYIGGLFTLLTFTFVLAATVFNDGARLAKQA